MLHQEEDSDTRVGWTNVIIFPPEPQAAAEEVKIAFTLDCYARIARFSAMSRGLLVYPYPDNDKPTEEELYMMCGPKMIGMRLSMTDIVTERAALLTQGLDVSAMFPAMTAALNKPNDKYLHFSLNRGTLTIASKMKKDALVDTYMYPIYQTLLLMRCDQTNTC
jgi:hypothetical protein